MKKILQLVFIACYFSAGYGLGPRILASKGAVWPKPQQQDTTEDYYIITPHTFSFELTNDVGCPNFINEAFTRYWTLIAISSVSLEKKSRQVQDEHFLGYLETLNVDLRGKCSGENILPALEDVEDYSLTLDLEGGTLVAETIWGILRGLETFSHLIYSTEDSLTINATTITDFPRFPHRGLLIDTSRHFEPVPVILQMLDAMAYNKFNVFHWHLTDDQSFPYKSRTFPELSDLGAYHPVLTVYQQSDVAKVIEYARLRGIRVIPEFDTPGHTSSWGASHPELLTDCYTNDKPNGNLGPMDPTKETTYEFVSKLFAEVVEVFPESYFHIGGDEVDFDCWKNNPKVTAFMAQNNMTTYEELESYFIQHVVDVLDSLNSKHLVWEEVFKNGVVLPNSTVVHVWKTNGLSTLSEIIKSGKYGLYSSCWYLSDLQSGGNWNDFYRCEPLLLIHEEEQRKRMLGGEACMWGEYVNEFSIMPRVWPRASAIAERLWSAEDVTDTSEAEPRLEEHTCRMNKRGIAAQPPNGPGVCL